MHSRVEPHHKYKQSIRRSHPSRTEESIKSHTIHTTKQEISLTITSQPHPINAQSKHANTAHHHPSSTQFHISSIITTSTPPKTNQ